MELDASVIVRAKDKADTIEATLRSLRAQTHPVQIIVVDSGSTDGTLHIARRWADEVIEIASSDFTYGRALNIGAAAASSAVHFALSAHCVPATDTWVADSLALYADSSVAATNQAVRTPTGHPIHDRYLQSVDDVRAHPAWGFSNHASSWRADVWEDLPFREDLPACEDKEWSWRVLASGHTIAYSPDLVVSTDHRRGQGPQALFRRMAREAEAMVSLGAARPMTVGEVVWAWWSSFPAAESRFPRPLRRLSPYRLIELVAAWSGGRSAVPVENGGLQDILGAGHRGGLAPWLPWFAGGA
ncbi:glycosyltransferase [Geodermatophilus sp. SYSU D01119]